MSQQHSSINPLNKFSSDEALPPTHSTFTRGGGVAIIFSTHGYVHFDANVGAVLAYVQ